IILRAEQYASDLNSAIDTVHDNLQRQIQRYKDKHWRRGKLRRQAGEIVEVGAELNGVAGEENGPGPRARGTTGVQGEATYSAAGVEQMELLGHDFFVFRDAGTSQINVLYRREDGNYGLIVPGDAEK